MTWVLVCHWTMLLHLFVPSKMHQINNNNDSNIPPLMPNLKAATGNMSGQRVHDTEHSNIERQNNQMRSREQSQAIINHHHKQQQQLQQQQHHQLQHQHQQKLQHQQQRQRISSQSTRESGLTASNQINRHHIQRGNEHSLVGSNTIGKSINFFIFINFINDYLFIY